MDGPNVNWKMVEIANKHCKEQDLDAPSLLDTGSCAFMLFMVPVNLKNCFSILKKSSARRAAYLKFNALIVPHEGKGSSYLFPLMYCGHCWLENKIAVGRIIELLQYIKQYLEELKEKKAFLENDD